ncbi:MAG: LuxR family transcriptional regulator [Actinomycetales bacterium]|nr:LuxR family transcriptional regulator [Actinomycetales bacterium]
MSPMSLTELARKHVAIARTASSGRSARTVMGHPDTRLRQTVMALVSGHELAEHESPGAASLQVLVGAVRLTAGSQTLELRAGDLVAVPGERHSVLALEDSAFLLSIAPAR